MNVKIGARIKELRKRDGVTQEQLANIIGVTNQAISKWESEIGYPDIDYIMPIADFFNVSIDYLFGRKRTTIPAHDPSKLTKEDRDACLPIIDFMMECSVTAKKKGLWALELFARNQGSEFIALAIELLIDGTDPRIIEDILQKLAHTESQKETHTAKQHLEHIIVTEGVLSIQAGYNLRLLEIKLLCCLGEDYLKNRLRLGTWEKAAEQLASRLAKLSDKTFLQESINFIKTIQSISKTDIQNTLREVDLKDFTTALLGCDGATIEKFMDCISDSLALMILDKMDNLQKQEPEILEAQEKITAIINKLIRLFE